MREDHVLDDLAHRCVHGTQKRQPGPPGQAPEPGHEHGEPEDDSMDELVAVRDPGGRPRCIRGVERDELQHEGQTQQHWDEAARRGQDGHGAKHSTAALSLAGRCGLQWRS